MGQFPVTGAGRTFEVCAFISSPFLCGGGCCEEEGGVADLDAMSRGAGNSAGLSLGI